MPAAAMGWAKQAMKSSVGGLAGAPAASADGSAAPGLPSSRASRRLIQVAIAGSARALNSAPSMIASCARAATIRPPEVALTGAKFASSVARAASLKFIKKLEAK